MQPDRDPGDIIDMQEGLEERRLLNKVHLQSFTATPGTIVPFQKSTLTWHVTIPDSVSSVLDVTIKLGNTPVPASGSYPVSPLNTGAFLLTAHSPNASRNLGTAVVHVDVSDAMEGSIPRAGLRLQAQRVKDIFLAEGVLWARGDVDVEMLPPDRVKIKVPLEAELPNFYNCDIDVDIIVRLAAVNRGTDRVSQVTLTDVSVDVVFHLAEHIFSLGAATAAQAMFQGLLATLIKSFMRPQIENTINSALQQIVTTFLTNWKAFDPQKRTFRLYSITVDDSPGGVIITAYPVPATINPRPEQPPLTTSTRRKKTG